MRAPQSKPLGRMMGHTCKCGATIICPPRVRPCTKKHVSDGDGVCVVCMEVPPEAVFVPCGHLVACMQCVSHMSEAIAERREQKKPRPDRPLCLVCRARVKQIVKVFTT
ncbi:hypothetical protein M758_6G071900 [Ceratodon purpureus]|uniref:RING-type domain-containing protein n=1 Tax=Ceratodon purpureus TaxID=3225 RepID=A0A8T0HID2_CERPU|nr:hypothetical protein KC19_6G076500 [Ceratodon purpureus]KAG0569242.1 hypothetical protein KC19_6G076500 [Ceratodon purpureus]KAG0613040.1 hypothetical protein M758_6G071900 [Ceratodon purpureus]